MRLPHLLFSGLAIAALFASHPAAAFSVTNDAGVNASNAGNFADPDEQVDHIANGGGPSLSTSWGDRRIPTSDSAAASGAAPLPPGVRWSDSWFAPSLIIAGKWHYPPSPP